MLVIGGMLANVQQVESPSHCERRFLSTLLAPSFELAIAGMILNVASLVSRGDSLAPFTSQRFVVMPLEGDHSAADMAFCCMVAFYTGEAEQIDSIFRQSGLYREKWEREDYRTETITKALALTHACYKGRYVSTDEAPFQRMEGFERGTSALVACIMLMLAEWGWNEEDKVTFLAMVGLFGGRQTARMSRATLATYIRKRENSQPEGSKAEDQFGGRRLTNLRKRLRARQ